MIYWKTLIFIFEKRSFHFLKYWRQRRFVCDLEEPSAAGSFRLVALSLPVQSSLEKYVSPPFMHLRNLRSVVKQNTKISDSVITNMKISVGIDLGYFIFEDCWQPLWKLCLSLRGMFLHCCCTWENWNFLQLCWRGWTGLWKFDGRVRTRMANIFMNASSTLEGYAFSPRCVGERYNFDEEVLQVSWS